MIAHLIWLYLCGWVITTSTAFAAVRTLPDKRRPPTMRTFAIVSVMAGALWPLLLLGLAEVGSVMTLAKLTH